MALQIFLARRFVTERAKDRTQHLSNSKKIIKINWFHNPLPLNNKNITWSQAYLNLPPKSFIWNQVAWKGENCGNFNRKETKTASTLRKAWNPISYQVIEF